MSLNAYKVTCQQAATAAKRARAFAHLASQCKEMGAPAPWAVQIARDALEEADMYMALARAELSRMEELK